MKYEGGYYCIERDLIHDSEHKHLRGLKSPLSEITLGAVNAMQRTPWAIDRFILDTVSRAWNDDIDLGKALPRYDKRPLPRRPPQETPEKFDVAAWKEYKISRKRVEKFNAKVESRFDDTARKIRVAHTMAPHDRFWYPHFVDFRTRIYPDAQDLHPQSDDLSQGLLTFADAVPLGDRGLRWLAIQVANCAGYDKAPLAERERWAYDNLDWISLCVLNPLENREWTEWDSPWKGLATAREWFDALSSDNPEGFLTRRPIAQDGSVNGYQHLSLMGRDRRGAIATNCADNKERQDLYGEVLKIVLGKVERDARAGNEQAIEWMQKGVVRDTVKRPVMTTAYGVTEYGIRSMMFDDGHVDGMNKMGKAAEYMQEAISDALTESIAKGMEIMDYFQKVAEALAVANKPLRWVTPAGSACQQAYKDLVQRRVKTLSGTVCIKRPAKGAAMNVRKMASAAAPNIVHSCDASHLQRTVVECTKRGMRSFHMIHDSFGVHAPFVDEMRDICRRCAYEQYSGNYLRDFAENIASYAKRVKLPDPPEQGDFDVSEVLRSEFFFS